MTDMQEKIPSNSSVPLTPDKDGRQMRGDRTRQALVESAFEEIYMHGFRAASLNDIIKKAGCTKGSLYHHFADKHALGLAATAEFMGAHIKELWIDPLAETADPLTSIRTIIGHYAFGDVGHDPRLGCPFQNLTQEMAGIDEDFQNYFKNLFEAWRDALVDALKRGERNGTVRKGIDAESVATLIIASHQGVASMIKATQDEGVGHTATSAFFDYLDSLRP
jgi:AcrR family transcriptional regulator